VLHNPNIFTIKKTSAIERDEEPNIEIIGKLLGWNVKKKKKN
jgi:hypothetical protein